MKAKRNNKAGLRMEDICQSSRQRGDVEGNNRGQTESLWRSICFKFDVVRRNCELRRRVCSTVDTSAASVLSELDT